MKFIGILDYGSGNILSVCRAIEKIGFNAKLIRTNGTLKTYVILLYLELEHLRPQ